jgi:hypothetical protein
VLPRTSVSFLETEVARGRGRLALCNVRRAMIRVCPDTRCEVVCRHRFEWVRSGQLPFLSGEGGWLSCPRHGMAWGRTGASVRCLVSCCGGRLGVMLETPPLHVSLARARSGSVLWFPGYRRKFQSKWLRAKGFWARALRQKRPCPGACILAHSGTLSHRFGAFRGAAPHVALSAPSGAGAVS